jgi:hypothetical protein
VVEGTVPSAEDWLTSGRGRLIRGGPAAAAFALGVVQTWIHRHAIWPDVVSYLDVGDAFVRGEWRSLLGGIWSPLYACTIGLALAVTEAGPTHELAVLKGMDLLLYAGALVAFDLLLKEVVRAGVPGPGESADATPGGRGRPERKRAGRSGGAPFAQGEPRIPPVWPLPPWIVVLVGHTAFFWASQKWLVVYRDNPDMMMAGLVFLAAALLLRGTRRERMGDFALLGIVLGLGYLAKTVMLPLGLAFVAAAAVPLEGRRPSGRRVLATLAAFLAVAAPFAAALSWHRGRPTIGEAGRLNYAWLVNPAVPDTHWQGQPPGSGRPRHPTRKVFEAPDVYEYASPIGGTYPPWFDPAYWNEGLVAGFDRRQQARIMVRNLAFCARVFLGTLVLGALVAAALGARPTRASLLAAAPLLLPGLAGVTTYVVGTILPVHKPPWGDLQARYMGAFIVLVFVGVTGSLRVREGWQSGKVKAAALVACATSALVLIVGLVRGAAGGPPEAVRQWPVAEALLRNGVHTGDAIGLVGVDPSFHWWARLAGVKIVTEVEARGFWTGDDATRSQVLAIMRRAGARALVSPPPLPGSKRPKDLAALGWRPLGPGGYYVLPLVP